MSTVTAAQMVAEAKTRIRNLSPTEAAEAARSEDAVLIDLREPAEVADQGLIPGAVHAPRGMLEFWADPTSPYHRPEFDPQQPVVLYCASGGRSALAGELLQRMGYRDVSHLDGGFKAWAGEGRPVETAPATEADRR